VDRTDPPGAVERPTCFRPLEFELPRGKRLTVREMADGDARGIWLLYESLSSEDRYHRFFAQSHPSRDFTEHWVHNCRTGGAGLVAVATDGAERVVGEAAYVLVPDGDAELALTVAPDWRGWLGPYLLHLLVDLAATRGIRNLEADVLVENRPMLALLQRRPCATLGDGDFNVERIVIGARERRPGWPPVGARPRVLVEGRGARGPAARALDRAGFEVMGCAGPAARGVSCPVLEGQPCPLARDADAIVVALAPDPAAARLVSAHRRSVPGTPVVVQVSDHAAAEAAEPDGGVRRLPADAPPTRLVAALEAALVDRASTRTAGAGPRDLRPSCGGPEGATTER
jgi:RimJ/RimL family protein N-acetyltransferase